MTAPRNANEDFDEFEHCLNQGSYRRAYELWPELQQHVQAGRQVLDLPVLRRRLDDEARAARKRITAELDGLRNTLDSDEGLSAFDAGLEALYNASPPDDQADYATYRAIYEDRKANYRRLQAYNRTRALVEDQWEQANRLSLEERDTPISGLLPFYSRALEIADEAAAHAPDNTLLQMLAQQARARREELNSEEEIMTSGGQIGDFVRVLRYVDTRREGEAVMVYNNDGTPRFRMTAEAARAEVVKNARAYVAEKAPQYGDEIRDRLNAFDARGASVALQRYDKFIELEQLVPDLFRASDRQYYTELLQQTREALQKLEQAEKVAERARKVTDNPLNAWLTFLQALPIYPGIYHSALITDTLETIAGDLLRAVRNERQAIESRLNELRFDEVSSTAAALLASCRTVSTPPTNGVQADMIRLMDVALRECRAELEAVEALRQTAQAGIRQQKDINKELHQIGELPREKAQEAAHRLNALLREYDPRLVERDPLYLEVNSRVKASQNAAAELARLNSYLDDFNIDQVRAAQNAARDAAQHVPEAHRRSFSQLAAQLGRHIEELEAEAALFVSGYDEAIRRYQALARQSDLGETLKKRIKKRLEELQRERDQAEANNQRLTALNDLIDGDSDSAIRQVWDGLDRIERFTNEEQQRQWLSLLRRSFERLEIDTPFDLKRLGNLLERAREIDSLFAASWHKRLETYKTCQHARDETQRGQFDNALRLWRSVEDSVSAEDHAYVARRIRDLTKTQERAHKDRLLSQLARREDKHNFDTLLADIADAANNYRALASQSSEALDKVEFLTWAVELDLYHAQHRPEVSTQRELLRAASEFARRQLEPAIRGVRTYNLSNHERAEIDPLLNDARDVLRRADTAAVIAAALDKVDNYLREDADIGLFGEAVSAWQQAFVPADDGDGRTLHGQFEPLRQWYSERAERIANNLRQKIQDSIGEAQAELAPQNLPRYAKLLLLNPNDDLGKTMLRQLALSGEILRRRFVDLVNDLPVGLDHTGSGEKVLKNQVEDLREQQMFFNLVIDIGGRFPAPLRQTAGRDADSLTNDSRRYSALLADILRLMTQLQQKVAELQSRLNGFGLDELNLERFEGILAGYFADLQESAQGISRELADLLRRHGDLGARTDELERLWDTHPVMREMADNHTTLVNQYRAIADTFLTVRQMAQSEQFAEAHSLIERAPFTNPSLRELFSRSAIRDTFTVRDPYTQQDYRGWEAVVRWVRERRIILDRIAAWAAPFESASGVVGWNTPLDAETAPDLTNREYYDRLCALVEQQDFTRAVRDQVNALVAQADFETARALLKRAAYKGGALPGGLRSLEEAREQVSRFPLADQDGAFTGDINLAVQRAGSLRGRELLRAVYENRWQLYNTQLEEAERLFKTIDDKERYLATLMQGYTDKLAPVARLVAAANRPGLLGKRGSLSAHQKRELQAAYDAVRSHISLIRESFPYHPQLWTLENQAVIKAARELV